MENVKRVTKKDRLGELKLIAEEVGRLDLAEFCEAEIKKLANRKVTQTKNQKENEEIMGTILEVLNGLENPVTVTELIASDERLSGFTNQKISALMKKLLEAKEVVKTVEKKKSYFSIA